MDRLNETATENRERDTVISLREKLSQMTMTG